MSEEERIKRDIRRYADSIYSAYSERVDLNNPLSKVYLLSERLEKSNVRLPDGKVVVINHLGADEGLVAVVLEQLEIELFAEWNAMSICK